MRQVKIKPMGGFTLDKAVEASKITEVGRASVYEEAARYMADLEDRSHADSVTRTRREGPNDGGRR